MLHRRSLVLTPPCWNFTTIPHAPPTTLAPGKHLLLSTSLRWPFWGAVCEGDHEMLAFLDPLTYDSRPGFLRYTQAHKRWAAVQFPLCFFKKSAVLSHRVWMLRSWIICSYCSSTPSLWGSHCIQADSEGAKTHTCQQILFLPQVWKGPVFQNPL